MTEIETQHDGDYFDVKVGGEIAVTVTDDGVVQTFEKGPDDEFITRDSYKPNWV